MAKAKVWSAKKKTMRKDELMGALPEAERFIYTPLVDNLVMLEERMDLLRHQPFIRISKSNPCKQIPTSAATVFKNVQIEYLSALKDYNIARGGEVQEESSPLREYLKNCGFKSTETL